ncbi:carotenoid biosynthesis protein [Pontibacter cellulosilyticus]|uniref:Carotenoid biosynthesis protein n=1 Tax=Pontibacter cellulosilyticus TaxID=1720253 RepID=A0A923SKS4_9BACT|nr:carotenoid biosynthesis protein [Pontibacter cellulosilyticus]MBC5994076.1 carotenoid biosynthesis protein [Pontibacter cellulosilyticus]
MLKTIGTQPQTHSRSKYKKYGLPLAIAVLVIFHAVGLWGLLFSGDPEYFQNLTPMNLLLTNALLFSFHKSWNKDFILFAIFVFAVGFFSEVVGVHTGLLFGDYTYGEALGLKVWEVPVLIGLNWLMLVYTTGHISNYTGWHWIAKAIFGAGLMVLLDFFIEPVAMQYDFWSWSGNTVPFTNYVGWFMIALVLQLYFHKSDFKRQNRLAPMVYLVQLLFFVVLFLFII